MGVQVEDADAKDGLELHRIEFASLLGSRLRKHEGSVDPSHRQRGMGFVKDAREDGRTHSNGVALEPLEAVDVGLDRCLWVFRRSDDKVGVLKHRERWGVISVEMA